MKRNTGTTRDFERNARYAAPVQTQENEWEDFLSGRELEEYDRASSRVGTGALIAIAGNGLMIGGNLLLGGTVAAAFTPFVGLVGAGVAIYGVGKIWKNGSEGDKLRDRAERRQGDYEVAQRHNKNPSFNPS